MINLETYYSFPNIDEKNNNFRYSPDNGENWYDISIPIGSYGIEDINNTIQFQMKLNEHVGENDKYLIKIEANRNTLRSKIELSEGYQVDFRPENSISSVLGFDKNVVNKTKNPKILLIF